MNETIVHQGGKMVAENFSRGFPWGRDPLFGLIHPFMIWNLVIVAIVILIFWWLVRNSHKHESALNILKKRYASGEIDEKTYLKMREEISD